MSPPALARPARADEMAKVMALRDAVFCDEQGVPRELEHDADDAVAVHVVAVEGDAVIGTCRLLPGDGEGTMRLGRMAVLRERRGEGLGALILEAAHGAARERGAREIAIHAQVSALGFWERAGYVAEGEEFEEAGIAHLAMRRPLEVRR